MTKRGHTKAFSSPATGFVSAAGKHRLAIGFDAETMKALNRVAQARGRSVSSTAADIVKMTLAVAGHFKAEGSATGTKDADHGR